MTFFHMFDSAHRRHKTNTSVGSNVLYLCAVSLDIQTLRELIRPCPDLEGKSREMRGVVRVVFPAVSGGIMQQAYPKSRSRRAKQDSHRKLVMSPTSRYTLPYTLWPSISIYTLSRRDP